MDKTDEFHPLPRIWACVNRFNLHRSVEPDTCQDRRHRLMIRMDTFQAEVVVAKKKKENTVRIRRIRRFPSMDVFAFGAYVFWLYVLML